MSSGKPIPPGYAETVDEAARVDAHNALLADTDLARIHRRVTGANRFDQSALMLMREVEHAVNEKHGREQAGAVDALDEGCIRKALGHALRECDTTTAQRMAIYDAFIPRWKRLLAAPGASPVEQAGAVAVKKPCADCGGSGMDGDTGDDGRCITVDCPACRGTGLARTSKVLSEDESQPFYDLAWEHAAKARNSFDGDELESLTFAPRDFETFCAALSIAAPGAAIAAREQEVLIDKLVEDFKAAARSKPTATNGYNLKIWENLRLGLRTLLASRDEAPAASGEPVEVTREMIRAGEDYAAATRTRPKGSWWWRRLYQHMHAAALAPCKTCNGHGLVGGFVSDGDGGGGYDAEPCPDCGTVYPPLPEGWPARFRCESCEGNGEVGDPIYQGELQPPERARCPDCDGRGWTSEEHAFNQEHMREYVDADRAALHPIRHAAWKRGEAETVRALDAHLGGHPGELIKKGGA